MMKEIPGYPGYKINENGVVINKKGHVMKPAVVLASGANPNQKRLRLALETYDENGRFIKRDNIFVSRLVATTFIPNPNNLPIVMHKDDDPLHNHVSNLQWGTVKDNVEDMWNKNRQNPCSHVNSHYLYNLISPDGSEVIKCNGCEGVAKITGLTPKYIRPMIIKSGKFAGYTVENTGRKLINPFYFVSKP